MSDARTDKPNGDSGDSPDSLRLPQEAHPVSLSAADAAALDQLLAAGSDAAIEEIIALEMRKNADPARVQRVGSWLQALGAAPAVKAPERLLTRTMEAVEDERANSESEVEVETPAVRSAFFSRRFAEYGAMAIAASVLIAVLIPGISQARFNAKRYACANNLGTFGRAFDQYATASNNELPSLAMPADHDFRPRKLATATETNHSNAANLLPLLRGGYRDVGLQSIACPGRTVTNVAAWNLSMSEIPDNLRGYSYANLMGAVRPHWDHASGNIIMADRNPIFSAAGPGSPTTNSPNHRNDGNYVLRANGAVDWEHGPNVGPNRDNIWTVAYKLDPSANAYDGTETPKVAGDVFLSP